MVILLGCSESVAQFLHKTLRLTIFLNKGQQVPVMLNEMKSDLFLTLSHNRDLECHEKYQVR